MSKRKIPLRAKDTSRAKAVQKEINKLLFYPTDQKTDKELLTITILTSKAHHFRFLSGYTEMKATGHFKSYRDEQNTIIEIEFEDTPSESVGKRLMTLFKEYNRLVIGEEVLYVRTSPIEESTLN